MVKFKFHLVGARTSKLHLGFIKFITRDFQTVNQIQELRPSLNTLSDFIIAKLFV